MMQDPFAAHFERLIALMERMASAQPIINVHVNIPDLSSPRKKQRDQDLMENDKELPEPGGMPHPWVS